ncbi:MAG: hypothetical protein MJA27_26465 [Pseudanabaenales cyanobacterium]|nr:hypothetical protein [Pseudanabaenales cyanobacterium]
MSIHTLSDLAVQDISDESAAVHSGGVTFTWYNDVNGTDFNDTTSWSDGVPVGFETFHYMFGRNDNNLESFRMTGAVIDTAYRVSFYDGNDISRLLGWFTLDPSDNDVIKVLAPNLRNRTSSLVITRIPS